MASVTRNLPGADRRGGDARTGEPWLRIWLFLAALSALLLVHNGGLSGLDGETFYAVARSAVDHTRLDVGEGLNTVRGVGDRQYAKSNFGMPALAAVVYAMSAPLAIWAPGSSDLLRTGIVGASMTAVAAALLVAVYSLALTLGAGRAAAIIAGIGSVAGTYLLPYSKEFFAEPLSALGLVIAIDRALAGRPRASGLGLAIALIARGQSILVAPVLVYVVARRSGARGLARAAAPVAVSIALTAAYNIVRFGSPLDFGYAGEGFTMPFRIGAAMLLFEPSKSVLLFAPVIVLLPWACVSLWRRDRTAVVLLASTLGITFAVAALWHNPNGGWCWGPRLLIPGLVPAMAMLGPWIDRPIRCTYVLVLLLGGFLVSAPAVAVSTQVQQMDVPPPAGGVWPPGLGLPRIDRQAELLPITAAYTVTHLFDRQADGRNYLRYLTFWQISAARVWGPPGLLAALIASSALLGFAIHAARRCRRWYVELEQGRSDVSADHAVAASV